jgi:peptidyl-tRNA hydrolase, PTH1 family
MKLIVGLGNPGEKYESTRHNLGFIVLEKFLKEFSLVNKGDWKTENKFKCETAEIEWQRQNKESKPGDLQKALLVRPLTYMNNSGLSVKKLSDFYKINTEDIWIIHDDVDITFEAMKIRFGGASAGHKGVESIIESLGTDKFWRFRLGIGHPTNKTKLDQKSKIIPVDEYVLKGFGRGEAGKLKHVIKKAVKALESSLEDGLESTMNRFNAK